MAVLTEFNSFYFGKGVGSIESSDFGNVWWS